jgi:site-specific DNA-methyltransferase (adenine-specific)
MIIESLKSLAVPIDSLKGLPGNPRRGDVDAVAASLSRFGQRKPIVVRKDDGTIIAGNHTWQAAKKLGWSEIAVAYVGDDDVTAQAYALADNRTAELGDYDDELLKALIDSVGEVDSELLKDTGWSDDAVAELLQKIESENPKVIDEDEVPELPVEAKTKLGDLYHLGRHRLLCGDSTDEATVARLMDGAKADMVFTDPPYGVNYDGGHATEKRREKLKNDNAINMYGLPISNAYKFSEKNAPLYLWFADTKVKAVIEGLENANWEIRSWIIWNKNMAQFGAIGAQYKQKHEPCIYAFKKGEVVNWCGPTNEVSVWDINRHSKNEFHPTQKPIELVTRALKNHNATKILDLFGGSGSTLIAAEQVNRTCYMMELDPKYCDVIIQRWETLTGEKAVLITDAESAKA